MEDLIIENSDYIDGYNHGFNGGDHWQNPNKYDKDNLMAFQRWYAGWCLGYSDYKDGVK